MACIWMGWCFPKAYAPIALVVLAIEKGCVEGGRGMGFLFPFSGLLIGHKVVGLRMVLEDGVSHSVDSSENAFKAAAMGAMRACE